MNRMRMVCVMYEAFPEGRPCTPEHAEEIARVVGQLLEAMAAFPRACLTFQLCGYTLEQLEARHATLLEKLSHFVSSGQLEMLGGTRCAAVLTGIPKSDAVFQLRQTAQILHRTTGRAPGGCWLPLGVWDSSLPRLLAGCGIRYTLLDGRQLADEGGQYEAVSGIRVVDRLGYLMSIFATDPVCSVLMQNEGQTEVLEYLSSQARQGISLMSCAIPLEHVSRSESVVGWFEEFLSLSGDKTDWLEPILPESALKVCKPGGVVHNPAFLIDEVAERAIGPEKVKAIRRARSLLEDSEQHPSTISWLGGVSWDLFLGRYPEANLLHKKMLWVSTWVQRMGRLARQRQQEGGDASAMVKGLERAQAVLSEAQCFVGYWPAPEGGLYCPEVRQSVYQNLLRAQRIVEAVFFPEPNWVDHQQVDLDRDGRDEILTSTPKLLMGISTFGGGAFELSYKPEPCNFLSVMGRRPELEHDVVRRIGVGEPGRGESFDAPPAYLPDAPELESRLRYDRYPRLSFLDHFLGSDATVRNFYHCQYPEVGDFLNEPYTVLRVGYERRTGVGLVHMSRNGHVGEPNSRKLMPIRVEKKFLFDDRRARLVVQYALTNRGYDPVSIRFGPELSFGLPLVGKGLSGGSDDALVPLPREADGRLQVGSAEDKRVLHLEVPETGVRVVVRLATPGAWWWFPLETIRASDSRLDVSCQGTVFLPHWEISLWGQETQSVELSLEVEDPVDESGVVDVIENGE